MRNRTNAHTQTATGNGARPRRARVHRARRPSPELISAGVVASYIHQISDRHRHRDVDELWSVQPVVLSPCGA